MRKRTPNLLMEMIDGKPEGNKGIKPEGNKGIKPEGNKEIKPEGNKEIKPEGNKEIKPEGNKEIKPEGNKRGVKKEKVTFNLSQNVIKMLENGWLEIRQIKKGVPKSLIVEKSIEMSMARIVEGYSK